MAVGGTAARRGDSAAYERAILRVGAGCAVAGPLLATLVNIVHARPSPSEVGEHEAFLRLAAESGTWVPVHIGLIVAILLFVCGFIGLWYSMSEGPSAWLARIALSVALVSAALTLVQTSVDLAIGQVADDWAAAPSAEKPTALRVGAALEDVDFMLLSVELMTFFGLTVILFGLAVATSGRYPSWLGQVGAVSGIPSFLAGIVQAAVGEASIATLIGVPIAAASLSLWLMVVGVILWRQTGRDVATTRAPAPP
jgi:hypothetical protein